VGGPAPARARQPPLRSNCRKSSWMPPATRPAVPSSNFELPRRRSAGRRPACAAPL